MDLNSWLFIFASIQALGVILAFFRVDVRLLRSINVNRVTDTPTRREKVMCVLAFGAFVLCVIGYWRTPAKTQIVARQVNFVKAWGAPGGSRRCNEIFDGAALMPWSSKYNIAVTCGLEDPTIDRFENTNITVSRPFFIRPGDIVISAPYSPAMVSVENHVIEEVRKSIPPTTPKGTLFSVSAQQWYEPVLLAKNTDVADIHKLSDVPKFGGAIISQGWPKE
jgi:hypothetical protein